MRPYTLLIALCLGITAPAFASGCSSGTDDGAEAGDQAINLGQSVVFQRLAESIAPLRRAAQADESDIGNAFRKLLADERSLVAETELDLVGKVARSTISSLGKQDATRKAMVQSSFEALTRRSNVLKSVLFDWRSVRSTLNIKEFDEIIIGAGPEAAAYVQESARSALMSGNTPPRILVVEAGAKPGGMSVEASAALLRRTGPQATPSPGDRNFLYDLWGAREEDPSTLAAVGSVSDITTVGLDISTAHTVLETEVVSISPFTPSRGYGVALRDVNSGQRRSVAAKRLIITTRMGVPKPALQDDATVKLIAEEAAKKAQSLKVDPENPYIPGVQTVSDVVNYVGQGKQPYLWAAGKKIAVQADGGKLADAANVVDGFLLRIAEDGAYKLDATQAGGATKVYLLGVTEDACKQLIAKSPGRYALLEEGLRSGRVEAVPAKLETITRTSAQYRVNSGDAQLEVDNVVIATAFPEGMPHVFDDWNGRFTPERYEGLLKRVQASVSGGDGAPVDVAGQLDRENIFFLGQADDGRALDDGSLFDSTARMRALARVWNQPGRYNYGSIDEIYGLVDRIELSRARTRPVEGILKFTAGPTPKLGAGAELELEAEMSKLLARFDLPGELDLNFVLTRGYRPADDGSPTVELLIDGLSTASQASVASVMMREPRLMELVFGYLGPDGRARSVAIHGTTSPVGDFGWDSHVATRITVTR